MTQANPYGGTAQQMEKRQRKPLAIVDPVSHKTLDIAGPPPSASTSTTNSTSTTTETSSTETTTDSATTIVKPVNDTNKSQKQADFRHQFGKLLTDNPNPTTDKVTFPSFETNWSNVVL